MSDMYNELVYHLDLCILSYQLYTQTLLWPMDPYYEHLAYKGTNRRDKFMDRIQSERTSAANPLPVHLDPILYNYDQINPWQPAIASPQVGEWIFYNTPQAITNGIRRTYLARKGVAVVPIAPPVGQQPPAGATDDLYCFQGGTGAVAKTGGRAALSLMGFVLARQLTVAEPSRYAIHIAFRGSRSGSGGRAMFQAGSKLGTARIGNPDWVTDMQYADFLLDPVISPIGMVSVGFAISIKEMLPAIFSCLEQIRVDRQTAPEEIYVAGHSLGGALATHFISAMTIGADGAVGGTNQVPDALRPWPWQLARVITYGAPKVGDDDFQYQFNTSGISLRRIWLGDDLIAKHPLRFHQSIGTPAEIPIESKKTKPGRTDCHEPFLIRRGLIALSKKNRLAGSRVIPDAPVAVKYGEPWDASEPWKIYSSIAQVLKDPHFNQTLGLLSPLAKANIVDYMRTFLPYIDLEVFSGLLTSAGTRDLMTTLKLELQAPQQIDILPRLQRIKENMPAATWGTRGHTGEGYLCDLLMICYVLIHLADTPAAINVFNASDRLQEYFPVIPNARDSQ